MPKYALVNAALLLALVSATAVAQEPLPSAEAQAGWNFAPPEVGQFPADMAQAPTQSGLTCDLDCCFNACRVPCVYFQADALYWDRVGTGCSETLVIDTDDNSALFATDDLSF